MDGIIDLTTWEGTGEVMIGGTSKRPVVVLFDGPLAFVNYWREEEVARGIQEAEKGLRDERYELEVGSRDFLIEEIAYAREMMGERRYSRQSWIWSSRDGEK